ncbi:MAG: hypothetical protein ACYC35_04635 [Pirellulales bacterium]
MTRKRSFIRKIIYLSVVVVLLLPLSYLSQPATSDTPTAKGSPGGLLAQVRHEHGLSQADLGQIDPTSETIKLATLGLRGIAADILWSKANEYKMTKNWTGLSATLEQMRRVQPNFISVWRFQAWNLSYNVSVEFDDYRDRYFWVIKGINYLKDGAKYNEKEARLLWDIGWFTSEKIGRADEHVQFRRLFKEDDDFHGPLRPKALRDNWLVGKEWYLAAQRLVDFEKAPLVGINPLLFHSDPAKCQVFYAAALEEDGTFGEVAGAAWNKASREWQEYGARDIPTYEGTLVRLNDLEQFQEKAKKLIAALDALVPGLREKIVAEKRSTLSAEARQALDTPVEKRTSEQHVLVEQAEPKIAVTHLEVADRIQGPQRKQAHQLAQEAADAQEQARSINQARMVVNFEYWRTRCLAERTDNALTARQALYNGDRAYDDADMDTARKNYEDGFQKWRKVLDQFPTLVEDTTTGDDLMEAIQKYRKILDQIDEKFPEKFILQDVIKIHGPRQDR